MSPLAEGECILRNCQVATVALAGLVLAGIVAVSLATQPSNCLFRVYGKETLNPSSLARRAQFCIIFNIFYGAPHNARQLFVRRSSDPRK